MDLKQIKQVYFVGIGGIGMSALTKYFMTLGCQIAGYDKTKTEITDVLETHGVTITFDDDVNNIPSTFLDNKYTLIIYTPAIPKNHQILNYFINHQFEIKKRAEVLGIISKDTYCFAVAGTHGKTTTSSILAHILYTANIKMSAFLGGIVEGYNTNYISNGIDVTVVEADEFDRSFLHLSPDVACITSMDADHLDIYGDKNAIENSFNEFADKVKDKSKVFKIKHLPIAGKSIALNETADYTIFNKKVVDGFYQFDLKTPKEVITDIAFTLPGNHNIFNATTAFAMAYEYGINPENIKNALKNFPGIKRRFSFQIKSNDLVYVDDYAHHPTEIDAVYQALRELYPQKQITAVFQPHLFSRTKDFGQEFAQSLDQFDEILLMDIYPARELPMPGISSDWLFEMMQNDNKKRVSKENLIQNILLSNHEVIVTIGAGDIGECVNLIKDELLKKNI
jgi:UDP-N-acetylmuramate--alanine ligase